MPLALRSAGMSQLVIREATLDDADAVARTSAESWRSSYRGLLPDVTLDGIDVAKRAAKRRAIVAKREGVHLVACGPLSEIVGFCDAGPCRDDVPRTGEIYALYLIERVKRRGLGAELFDRACTWLRERELHALRVWVLVNNQPARRFYEALGGIAGDTKQKMIGETPVTEQAYVWDDAVIAQRIIATRRR